MSYVTAAIAMAVASVVLTTVALTLPSAATIPPVQQLHHVLCIGEYGDAQSYYINMPDAVTDVEQFSKGFCDSL